MAAPGITCKRKPSQADVLEEIRDLLLKSRIGLPDIVQPDDECGLRLIPAE
jgi:hypothetical protein